ncbi:DUF829 hypothetical protein [Helicosporidium sp. ATCC 50920]|nr:DUF829 hypothetical protein [Helicosporidium sp. ATCC 50920]|eukprot:KDD75403.1 DUF829 hypothetical protein [Helicosporidium sp. ATCC 50920]
MLRTAVGGPGGRFTATYVEDAPASRPVVALMGWAKAEDKILGKYSDILAQHGFSSIRSTLELYDVLTLVGTGRKFHAISLLEFLKEQDILPQRKIILYAFSNGGSYIVEQLYQLSQDNSECEGYAFLSSRVAGIVFDSAPAFPDGRTMRAATHSITREQPFSSRVLLYSWAQRRLHGLLRGSHAEQFWAVMERMDWGPLLFLYGRADTASEAHRIDLLVQRKREQGIEVDAQCWPDSGHIEHLRKHPEEYVQKLIAFLRGVDAGERPQAKL